MPLCIEKKLTLSGAVNSFECELLRLDIGLGVLKYVIDREYTVGPIILRPRDITYALYWIDRPYTLYIWRLKERQLIYYFNVADSVSLRADEIVWRDLSLDVLVDADRMVHVLDEDELSPGLPSVLLAYIQSAKAHILNRYQDIILEANAILRAQGILE